MHVMPPHKCTTYLLLLVLHVREDCCLLRCGLTAVHSNRLCHMTLCCRIHTNDNFRRPPRKLMLFVRRRQECCNKKMRLDGDSTEAIALCIQNLQFRSSNAPIPVLCYLVTTWRVGMLQEHHFMYIYYKNKRVYVECPTKEVYCAQECDARSEYM